MEARIETVETLIERVGVAALPGEKLTVMPGDTVRVRATLDYRGPALSDTFYGSVGNRIPVIGFDEIWVGSVPISFPASGDWKSYQLTVDIPITQVAKLPWTPGRFDLYVKIVGHLEAGLPELTDVIEVMLKGEFRNFTITGYDKV